VVFTTPDSVWYNLFSNATKTNKHASDAISLLNIISVFSVSTTMAELRIGGKWRLGRKIGSGSFGDIYRGTSVDKTAEIREVAIKLEARTSKHPQLLYEAKGKLLHPHSSSFPPSPHPLGVPSPCICPCTSPTALPLYRPQYLPPHTHTHTHLFDSLTPSSTCHSV
jgi:hypothetical protein